MNTRVAIVGSGIAGLSAAHHLRNHADVTLFEAHGHFGGHAHTVDVCLPGPRGLCEFGVDTGFLVFNERTYPGLIALFQTLGVRTAPSDMSFSVQAPWGNQGQRVEWNGANLDSVFAQRRNLLRPRFWWLLKDILRFNRLCTDLARSYNDGALMQPLQTFLDQHGFGATFRDTYLLPMLGCIWSCPTEQMLSFPAATMVRFCDNHGLLQVNDRPRWFTVHGGSKHYVDAIVAQVPQKHLHTPVQRIERQADSVVLYTPQGSQTFDEVILACHSDQALRMLAQPSETETELLSAIRFQDNLAVLHTDVSVMPQRRRAWAAWNYQRLDLNSAQNRVCLHYWLNRLQPLPFTQDVLVSLNPVQTISPSHILGQFHYAHPVFDLKAIEAQRRLGALQGQQRTWFAGAWMGYGFHEDGFKAGRAAAQGVVQRLMQSQEV